MLECNHISKKLPVSCFANEVLDGCIRINKIQEEIKEQNQTLPEDEQAFLDAAEEQYDMRSMTRRTGGRMFGR